MSPRSEPCLKVNTSEPIGRLEMCTERASIKLPSAWGSLAGELHTAPFARNWVPAWFYAVDIVVIATRGQVLYKHHFWGKVGELVIFYAFCPFPRLYLSFVK